MENLREGLFDQIFSSTAFLSALYGAYGKKKARGKGIRMVNGGERIRVPLLYGKNTTVGSYTGYDVLDTTPQDGITTAFFDWRQLAGSVSISRLEEIKNRGENAIKNLLETKVMQLEMSLRDELDQQLIGKTISSGTFIAGQGPTASQTGTDIDPLALMIPKDPTGSVSVGNINQATYSWWRPVTVDGSAVHGSKDSGANRGFLCSSWANLRHAMRWTYNSCGKGAGGTPDLILCDQLTYESYEASLDARSVINDNTKGPVSIGFESVRFKGADMVWDEYIPDLDGGLAWDSASWATGTMWFLNTDFIEFVIDSQTDFIATPFVRPENQDAKTSQILLAGNLTVLNRRKLGVIYGITAPITS
jgi:hypothetical protein